MNASLETICGTAWEAQGVAMYCALHQSDRAQHQAGAVVELGVVAAVAAAVCESACLSWWFPLC